MGEQPVHAVLGDGELGVVVVVGMDADSVGEGREARGHPHVGADDGRRAVRPAERGEMAADDLAALGDRAGQGQSQTVEDGFLAELDDLVRNVPVTRPHHESRHIAGERPAEA